MTNALRKACGCLAGLMTGFALMIFAGAAQAQQPAPTGAEQAWPYLAKLSPDERLKVLEREAKREGGLTWYASVALDRAEVFIKLFNQKYPDIKVDFVRLNEPQVPERLLLESRAKRTNADAILTQANYLDLLKDLLAPYEPLSWTDFDERFRFGGAKDGWTAVAFEVLIETIAWRTDRIKAEEAPKTLDEMANPKWKGRVGTTTNLERFVDAMIQSYGEAEAMKKIRALAELNNRMYKSYAAASDALAAGEIDITWEFLSHRPVRLKMDKAPVDFVYQTPAFGLANTVSVLKEAKRPYAAALFVDFASRPEVLEAMDKIEGGRVFGNRKGKYSVDVSRLSGLTMYRPISEAELKKYNRVVEDLFIRR
jgi:iron(III) transport system substrate-binding protein